MSLPLISIMMPAYNAEETILTALTSLHYQTYENWECIIVNDGSTDSTLDILKNLKDPRFRVYSFDKNRGRGVARQFCLEKTNGQYLAMLDADDWYYHDKLAKQVNFFLENPEVDLVSCGMVIQKEETCYGVRGLGNSKIENYFSPGAVPVPHASSMFKKEITLNKSYDIKFKFSQDTDFLRRILLGKKYALLDFPGYVYDEYISTNLPKIRQSYLFSAKSYLKFIKQYPFISIKNATLQVLKIFRLYLYNQLFGFEAIIKKRSSAIPQDLQNEYIKNLTLLKNHNKTF